MHFPLNETQLYNTHVYIDDNRKYKGRNSYKRSSFVFKFIILGKIGQRCTAVKLLIVQNQIADELLERVLARARALSVGHPEDNTDVTAVISRASADFIQGLYEDARKKGAKQLMEWRREGNLIWPMILDQVTTEMDVHYTEPFGPLLPVVRVSSIEEAIEKANGSPMGLQGSVFTRDINKALMIADKLATGTVQVNGAPARGPDHFPFQGFKDSGLGTQGVRHSLLSMTKVKSVVINLPGPSYSSGV
uniref:NADP-dependent glyceraldehyde-3-phosphate dehydrogenase n=1 Tax=Heterosigma akashiwo TaxID=2829 RepID=A0A7S3XRW2_HETAK